MPGYYCFPLPECIHHLTKPLRLQLPAPSHPHTQTPSYCHWCWAFSAKTLSFPCWGSAPHAAPLTYNVHALPIFSGLDFADWLLPTALSARSPSPTPELQHWQDTLYNSSLARTLVLYGPTFLSPHVGSNVLHQAATVSMDTLCTLLDLCTSTWPQAVCFLLPPAVAPPHSTLTNRF